MEPALPRTTKLQVATAYCESFADPGTTVVEEDQEGKIPHARQGSTIGLPQEYLDLFRLQIGNESGRVPPASVHDIARNQV